MDDSLRSENPVSHGEPTVQAQIDGEELFDLTEKMEADPFTVFVDAMRREVNMLRSELTKPCTDDGMGTVESNFGLYVDGWTMTGTGIIGQVMCKHWDGREIMVPSRALVAFLDRRVDV